MLHKSFCFCMLLLLCSALCSAGEGGKGVITGKWITKNFGPMAGAQVLLFNAASGPAPSSDKHLRIPDAGTPVDSEGKFLLEVPAGKYYLVMRKRVNPVSAGPPEEGDPQYYARLKNGQAKTFVVKSGKTTDIGTIAVAEPFKRAQSATTIGLTGIEGTVMDEQGLPVAGVRVLAYSSPKVQGRPMFASDKTGADGRYFLSVTQQGAYYLRVRTHYGGGKPVEGEFMGVYGKPGAPGSMVVEKDKISRGVDISVEKYSARREAERRNRRLPAQPSIP